MSVGERWILQPRRVVYMATLIPFLVVTGVAGEAATGDSGVSTVAVAAMGRVQSKLVNLQAGMLIGDKPPEDWSHIVLKSNPRLASGELASLPKGSKKTAAYFRTVILANVKPLDVEERDFELSQIGVGICVPKDEDHDMVVTGPRLQALGLHLSTVEKIVLDTTEAELKQGTIIARTQTFALFRSPATIVTKVGDRNEHSRVNLNYAFCVERTTGKLQVALWTSLLESKSVTAPTELVRLAPTPVFDCPIDVQPNKFIGLNLPFSWSFAMSKLPPGHKLPVPPELGDLIKTTARRPNDGDLEELERLERLLGQTLATIPAADKNLRRTAIPPPARALK